MVCNTQPSCIPGVAFLESLQKVDPCRYHKHHTIYLKPDMSISSKRLFSLDMRERKQQ